MSIIKGGMEFIKRHIFLIFNILIAIFYPRFSFSQCDFPASSTSVTSPADAGPGSLREAIEWANSNTGRDGIVIDGNLRIYISSPLPPLSDNAGAVIRGNGAFVDGISSSSFFDALLILSDNNCIENLNVGNFKGTGISIQNSNYNSFYNVNSSNNLFNGIAILGSSTNNYFSGIIANSNSVNGVQISTQANNNRIENCTVQSNANEGIYIFDSAYSNEISSCAITFNGENGVFISENSHSNSVNNSTIFLNYSGVYINFGSYSNLIGPNNTIEMSQYVGIAMSDNGTYGNVVTDNIILSNSFYGVFLNLGTSGNIIYRNIVESNGYEGIRIQNSGNNKLIKNTILNNSGSGVYIEGETSDNNYLRENTILNNSGHGIYLLDGDSISISSDGGACFIERNNRSGIYFEGKSSRVENASVQNCTIQYNNFYGIYGKNILNLTISSSLLNNNGRDGLLLQDSEVIQINSSNFDFNFFDGIYASNCSNITSQGGSATGNRSYGIGLYNSSNISFVNFSVNNNSGSNLYCFSSNTLQIEGGSYNSATTSSSLPSTWCYNSGAGICFENCSNATITSNASVQGNNYGIRIIGGSNFNISNLQVINNSIHSVQIESINILNFNGNFVSGGQTGLYIRDSSQVSVSSGNTFANQITGIFMFGIPEFPSSTVNGNSFSNCRDYCIFLLPDYGADRSPQGAGDDKTTRPEIKNNLFEGSPSKGAIYALDTQPSNVDEILGGSSGNNFNITTLAYVQAWMGIVYVVDYKGSPVSGASVSLTYQNGERENFTTGPDGIGAPYSVNPKANDVLTWGPVKGLILYPTGNKRDLQPAIISASGSGLTQQGSYSWDGNTDNDPPLRYALPPTTPGFEGVNTNGRYQAAILFMETSCVGDFLTPEGNSAYSVIVPGSVFSVILDQDENKNNSILEVVTGTVKVLDFTKTKILDSTKVEMWETTPASGYFKSNHLLEVRPDCPPKVNGICEVNVSNDPDCCLNATGEGTQYLRLEFTDLHDTYPPYDSCSRETWIKTNAEIHFYEVSNSQWREVTSYGSPSTITILVFDLDFANGNASDYKRIAYWVVSNGQMTQAEYSVPVPESFSSVLDGIYRDGYFIKYLQGVTDCALAEELNKEQMYSAVCIKPGDSFCVVTGEVGESEVSKCVNIIGASICSSDFIDEGQNPVSSYPTNSTVYMRVFDSDKNKNVNAVDSVSGVIYAEGSGDVEVVELLETGTNTGVFVGSIYLQKYFDKKYVVPHNGILSANGNELIRFSYSDADNPQEKCTSGLQITDKNTPSTIEIVDFYGTPVSLIQTRNGFYLRVQDPDGNQVTGSPDVITAVVFSGMNSFTSFYDREVISLTETSPSSGIFLSGNIPVNYGNPVDGDGKIQVSSGGITVAAFYQDPTDPTDRSWDVGVVLDAVLHLDFQLAKKSVFSSSPVPFRIKIENPNPVPLTFFTLEVNMPRELEVEGNGFYMDGRKLYARRGSPYSLPISQIAAGGKMYLSGKIVPFLNLRDASFKISAVTKIQEIEISNRDEEYIDVRPHPIEDKGRILGTVFLDENGNGLKDEGEPGFAGVEVCVDKGNCSMTDNKGRYHINDIDVGYSEGADDFFNYERVNVKININFLPPGIIPYQAGKVVELQKGMMKTLHFPLFSSGNLTKAVFAGLLKYRATFSGGPSSHLIRGNVGQGKVEINGLTIFLPSVDVDLAVKQEERFFLLSNGTLDEILKFKFSSSEKYPDQFSFYILDPAGNVVYRRHFENQIPEVISWDGKDEMGKMILRPETEYSFYAEIRKGDASARSSDKNFVVLSKKPLKTLEKGVIFETGKYYLLPLFIKKLRELSEYLRQNRDVKIIVEGHTDSTGPEWFNLELSQKRADMVKEYLVVVEGIEESRIKAIGYGESRPLYPNDTPENMARNRRVEIKTEEGKMLLQLTSFQSTASVNGKEVSISPSGEFEFVLPPYESGVSLEIRDNTGKRMYFHKNFGKLTAGFPPFFDFVPHERTNILVPLFAKKDSYLIYEGKRYDADEAGEISLPLFLEKPEGFFQFTVFFKETLPLNYLIKYESVPIIKTGYKRGEITIYLPEEETITVKSPKLSVTGIAPSSCTISVNNKSVEVNEDGTFSTIIEFPEGFTEHHLKIEGWVRDEVAKIEKKIIVEDNFHYINALGYGSGGISFDKDLENFEFHNLMKISAYGYGNFPFGLSYEFAADTGLRSYKNFLGKIIQLEPQRTYRVSQALSPEEEYPEYGDEAPSRDRTSSMGNTYLNLTFRKQSSLLFGGYDPDFTESELGYYSRALYGLKYKIDSSTFIKKDYGVDIKGFLAREKTAFERNEFYSTGGSIYLLRKKNLVEGSERIYVEVRDQVIDDLVLNEERYYLKRGVDYDIDYEGGRIHLFYPLTSLLPTRRAGKLLSGDKIVLVVEYEYEMSGVDRLTSGERVSFSLFNSFNAGANYVQSGEYRLVSSDIKVNFNELLTGVFEFGISEKLPGEVWKSYDGGIIFEPGFPSELTPLAEKRAKAWKAELGTENRFFRGAGYYRRFEKGFSSGRERSRGKEEFGLRMNSKVWENYALRFLFDEGKTGNPLSPDILQRMDAGGEIKFFNFTSSLDFSWRRFFSENSDNYGRESYIVPFFSYTFRGRDQFFLTPYIKTQVKVAGRGRVYEGGNQVAGGFTTNLFSPVQTALEGAYGESGAGARIGLSYASESNSVTYMNYSILRAQEGLTGQMSFGTSYSPAKRVKFYGEQNLTHGLRESRTNIVGLDWYVGKGVSAGIYYERTTLKSSHTYLNQTGGIILGYKDSRFNNFGKFELINSKNGGNIFGYAGEIYARTKIAEGIFTSIRFRNERKKDYLPDPPAIKDSYSELTLGIALRDIFKRLNSLLKFSAVRKSFPQGEGEIEPEGSLTLDLREKFYSAYMDNSIFILENLGLSVKTGWRREYSYFIEKADTTDRYLAGTGFSYNFARNWEFELDYLYESEGSASSQGVLLEVGRKIVEHLNLFLGYNFSGIELGDYDVDSYIGKHTFFMRVEGFY